MSTITVADQDVEDLLASLESDGTEEGKKRLQVVRAILGCVAFQAAQIDRLERLAQLDDAVMDSISKRIAQTANVKKLRKAFDAKASKIDIDKALRRSAALQDDIRKATGTKKTFLAIAKGAVSVAKLFV